MDAQLRALERAARATPLDLGAGAAFAKALERQGVGNEAHAEWARLARLGLEEAWQVLEPRPASGLRQPPSRTRIEHLAGRFYFRGSLGEDLLGGRWGHGEQVAGRLDPRSLKFRWHAPGAARSWAAWGTDVVRADVENLEWLCGDTGRVLGRSDLLRPSRGDLDWVPESPPEPEDLWVDTDRVVVGLNVGAFYAYQTFPASEPGAAPLYASPMAVDFHVDHQGGGHVLRWDTNFPTSRQTGTNRRVVAESIEDGSQTWVSDALAEVLAADGRGALLRAETRGDETSQIFEVDPRTGERFWSRRQTLHPPWIRSSPGLLLTKTSFMQPHSSGSGGSSCFEITAIDRETGDIRWTWRCPDVITSCCGFELAAETVYVLWDPPLFGHGKASLAAFDLETGRLLFQRHLELPHSASGSISKVPIVPLQNGLLICSADSQTGGTQAEWLEA